MREFTEIPAPTDAPESNEVGELIDLGKMPGDGFVLQMIRPKTASLIPMAEVAIDGTRPEQFKASMGLLRKVLTPESHTYLFDRLTDNADPFDVKHLGPILTALAEVLGKNPTG